jgi:hypothetical protein
MSGAPPSAYRAIVGLLGAACGIEGDSLPLRAVAPVNGPPASKGRRLRIDSLDLRSDERFGAVHDLLLI